MSEQLNRHTYPTAAPAARQTSQAEAALFVSPSEVWAQGDRQKEDEPYRGFAITRIERDTEPGPVAAEAALPLAFPAKHTQQGIDTLVTNTMADRLTSGEVELKAVGDLYAAPVNGLTLTIDLPVTKANYAAAVAEGHVKAGLFDETGRVGPASPDVQALQGVVDASEKHRVIKQALTPKAASLRGSFVNELQDLNSLETQDVRTLNEAYDLQDGDNTVRLLNLSGVPMSDEHLSQTVNAVRAMADKSGGGVYDRLQTIAVLPEEHRTLSVVITREDGQKDTIPAGGLQRGKTIFLSGRLLKDPEDRTPLPTPASGQSLFDRYGLPGEAEQGPGSPRKSVGALDLEPTLFHELEHAALPQQYHGALPGPAPSLYGRSNVDEHLSEIAAAMYMGGEYASEVPENQRVAAQQMWNNYRGTDKIMYNQPVGPHFVQCQELDVANGPLPLRVDKSRRQVVAEISYHIEAEQEPRAEVSKQLGASVLKSANLTSSV